MKTKILLLFLLLSQFSRSQCAMCKAVVEYGDKDLAEGVNSGITFLMLFPYLFLAIGIFIYYRNKKKHQKN
ncbi:MAG: hypothetical protein L3J23_03445 [Flavobacteriaceae bacterium]|nr:hypothetical protein [Flavobacteriaceae bacterium]